MSFAWATVNFQNFLSHDCHADYFGELFSSSVHARFIPGDHYSLWRRAGAKVCQSVEVDCGCCRRPGLHDGMFTCFAEQLWIMSQLPVQCLLWSDIGRGTRMNST